MTGVLGVYSGEGEGEYSYAEGVKCTDLVGLFVVSNRTCSSLFWLLFSSLEGRSYTLRA